MRAPVAALMLLALAGCGDGAPPRLPPDPPGVTVSPEDAFAGVVRAADREARTAVLDQLASRFGRSLHVLPRSIDSDAEPGAVKAYYDKVLGAARGWREFPLGAVAGAWAFATVSPDERSVVAVVALNPRFAPEGGGPVPLTILTTLEEAGGR